MSSMGYAVLNNELYLGGGIQGAACSAGARQYRWTPGVGWSATGALANLQAGTCDFIAYHIGPGAGVGDGYVWYIGGWDDCAYLNAGRAALSYDPAANCFPSYCNPTLSRPCVPFAAGGYAFASMDDKIFLLGGISGFAHEGYFRILNTVTRTVQSQGASLGNIANSPMPGRAFGAAAALDHRIYYMGGQFDNGGQWIFTNPCDNPRLAGGTPGACDIFCALSACGAFDCTTCPQCITGGGAGCDPADACTSRMDSYDPVANVWTPAAPMPKPLAGHAAVVKDYKIYVIGGVDSCLNYNTDILVYSPVCDSWETIPTVGWGGRVHHSGAMLTDGGIDRIYMTGGIDAISGQCSSSHSYMGYTTSTAPNVPTCSIDAPTAGSTVCDCVDIDYTVTDADTAMLTATWRYSTDDGLTWSGCTDKAGGNNPRMVPPGSGTFQWDAMTDVGAGPLTVTVAMCVSDGNEFAQDRVTLTVDCSSASCCDLAGDCDESQMVDVLDSLRAAQYDAGLADLSATAFANCNVHTATESRVSILDALEISLYIIGRIPALDCCP